MSTLFSNALGMQASSSNHPSIIFSKERFHTYATLSHIMMFQWTSQKVQNWSIPQSSKYIQQFLGLGNYYNCLVCGLPSHSTNLLKKCCFFCEPMNYLTKWMEVYSIPNHDTTTVANKLVNEFICQFSVSKQLHFDHSAQFESWPLKFAS